jgi:Predicted NADH:ubiquinone oxidoreductase, subunit RnfA
MEKLVALFVSLVLVNNIVLSQFMGIDSIFLIGKNKKSLLKISCFMGVVIVISSIVSYGIYQFLLAPLSMQYLDLLVFTLVIIIVVYCVYAFVKKNDATFIEQYGKQFISLSLNSVVLYVAMNNIALSYNWAEVIVYAFAASIGFILVVIVVAPIQERLEAAEVPMVFRGIPILLIVAGLMAIALSGIAGII